MNYADNMEITAGGYNPAPHPEPVSQSPHITAAAAANIVEILPANGARKTAFIQNIGEGPVWLYKDMSLGVNPFWIIAADTTPTTPAGDGGGFQINNWGGPIYAQSPLHPLAVIAHEI